jgi:hypothetical protein
VLSAGLHANVLGCCNGLLHGYTAEVRVGTESFPVAACITGASKRSRNRTKHDLGSLGSKLLAHSVAALVHDVFVPCGAGTDARGKDACVVCYTDGERTILET